jgi:hypothetical protein
MRDAIFGDSSEPEHKRAPRIAVPQRTLNAIELTLIEQLGNAMDALPGLPSLPFIEGGDQDFDGLTLRAALDLRNLLFLEAQEIFRRNIVIALELDTTATVDQYEIACLAEGVSPWPAGKPASI